MSHMATHLTDQRVAAAVAEFCVALPVHQTSCIGEQSAIFCRQCRSDDSEVNEFCGQGCAIYGCCSTGDRFAPGFIKIRRIDGKVGNVVVESEKYRVLVLDDV